VPRPVVPSDAAEKSTARRQAVAPIPFKVPFSLPVIDLGRMAYEPAYRTQVSYLDQALAARNAGSPVPGFLLLVEHDPVITISRRAGAAKHLIATPDLLAQRGVTVAETDRGGDITYHGPGQLVAYAILDLNALNLGLHAYMRLLEQAVIDTCAAFGVPTHRDPAATGVWTDKGDAKIAAMGVRVRRWISLHGLALNVTTNLPNFQLIVPCGLNRPVTSLQQELGPACPTMDQAKTTLQRSLTRLIEEAWNTAAPKRGQESTSPASIL
jgi:lipoyl(octanoyl) transferase